MNGPLASCTWLEEHLDDPDLRIVDTRWYLGQPGEGRRRYEQGHLPGAVFMDLDDELAAPSGPGRHPLPEVRSFGTMLGRFGIGNRHQVVVYDQDSGALAARLWWMLRSVGHARVSVLDGGYQEWTRAGRPTTRTSPDLPPTNFEPGHDYAATMDRDSLQSRLGRVQVLDARPPERYRGEVEPIDAQPGHIPTAISAPTGGNLNPNSLFKSSQELAVHFRSLGISPDRPVVSSCGSGVTACHNILALQLAGYPEAILYPGSWSDWASSGLPAVTGPDPGSVPV